MQAGGDGVIVAIIGLIGALVGGALSILAARSAVSHAERLRDRRARAALVSRLLLVAQSTQTIGLALRKSDPNSATAVGAMRELLAIWEPFDRMAPDLHLLGNGDLQADVFVLCSEARLLSRNVIEMEARAERIDLAADSGSDRAIARVKREAEPLFRVRDGVRTGGPEMAQRAQAVANRLQALQRVR